MTEQTDERHPFPRLRDALRAYHRYLAIPLKPDGTLSLDGALALEAATELANALAPHEFHAYSVATARQRATDPAFDLSAEIRYVTIPADTGAERPRAMVMSIPWVCPSCGEPRGPVGVTFFSTPAWQLQVDGWRNACGHDDSWRGVREEARLFARLRARQYGEAWADEHAPAGYSFHAVWTADSHEYLAPLLARAETIDLSAWNAGHIFEPAIRAAARRWLLHWPDDDTARREDF